MHETLVHTSTITTSLVPTSTVHRQPVNIPPTNYPQIAHPRKPHPHTTRPPLPSPHHTLTIKIKIKTLHIWVFKSTKILRNKIKIKNLEDTANGDKRNEYISEDGSFLQKMIRSLKNIHTSHVGKKKDGEIYATVSSI